MPNAQVGIRRDGRSAYDVRLRHPSSVHPSRERFTRTSDTRRRRHHRDGGIRLHELPAIHHRDRDAIRTRPSGDRPRTRYSSCPRAGGRETDWRLRVSRLVARERRRRWRPRGHRRTGRRVARVRGRCVRTRCRIGRGNGHVQERAAHACAGRRPDRLATRRHSCGAHAAQADRKCSSPLRACGVDVGTRLECAVAGACSDSARPGELGVDWAKGVLSTDDVGPVGHAAGAPDARLTALSSTTRRSC